MGENERIDKIESTLDALKTAHNITCESVTNNQINFIKRIIALEERQKEIDAIIKVQNTTEEK